jgi:ankyrin repeat protein
MTPLLRAGLLALLASASLAAHAGSYEDFFAAIKRDDAADVAALLRRGFDPNTRDPAGQHGLYLAIREPSPRVAQVLIGAPKTEV